MKVSPGLVISVVIFLSVIIGAMALVSSNSYPKNTSVVGFTPTPPSVLSNTALPQASPTLTPQSKTFPLGKSFLLPIKDGKGNVVEKVDFLVKEYEFTNQVVVNHMYEGLLKGSKELLVLHIEITNNTGYAFKVMAGDQVRLTKGGSDKLIAPDVKKDPVDVRPKSTAETKVGFILDKNDESLVLHLGELDGDTKQINIPRIE